MHYTSALETLESLLNPLSMFPHTKVGTLANLNPFVKVNCPRNWSWSSTRRLFHSLSIIKNALYFDYTSSLETLEGFSSALGRHYKHQVWAWAILYPLAKVRESQELLMVVNKVPSSLLVDS